jgi:hypothetical protein
MDTPHERSTPLVDSVVIVASAFVIEVFSLRSPEIPAAAPTAARPREVADELDRPNTRTVDTAADGRWHFFDFSTGSQFQGPRRPARDVAAWRFHVIAKGSRSWSPRGIYG